MRERDLNKLNKKILPKKIKDFFTRERKRLQKKNRERDFDMLIIDNLENQHDYGIIIDFLIY